MKNKAKPEPKPKPKPKPKRWRELTVTHGTPRVHAKYAFSVIKNGLVLYDLHQEATQVAAPGYVGVILTSDKLEASYVNVNDLLDMPHGGAYYALLQNVEQAMHQLQALPHVLQAWHAQQAEKQREMEAAAQLLGSLDAVAEQMGEVKPKP